MRGASPSGSKWRVVPLSKLQSEILLSLQAPAMRTALSLRVARLRTSSLSRRRCPPSRVFPAHFVLHSGRKLL
jgi:hypothetical protein